MLNGVLPAEWSKIIVEWLEELRSDLGEWELKTSATEGEHGAAPLPKDKR